MSKTPCLRVLFMLSLAVFLMAGLTTGAYSGQPEPPGGIEKQIGPATTGKLIMINGASVILAFSGECNGKIYHHFNLDWFLYKTFNQLSEEDFVDYRFSAIGPVGCRSVLGGEDLIVNTVSKFANDGNMLSADLFLQYVVPRDK